MKKTKNYLNPLAAAIALISGSLVVPQIALAQDEAREEEEVLVVSARRRNERLQDVPISLSSFSGEAMEKSGIQDIVQIGAQSPNTTLKVSRGTSSTITAFIRGIGQQDPVAGFEAGVGLYLDDVYLNRPQGAVLDVYDVERVEILRGPQGTLYGRNTIGGAIKYVTKRLSDEPELSIKGALGTYGQKDLIVTASTPIAGDTVKIGGSIARFTRDGFGENLTTGDEHYDKDVFAVRASLEYTPTDDLSIRLSADSSVDKSGPKAGHRLLLADGEEELDNVFDTEAGVTQTPHSVNKNEITSNGYSAVIEWSISDELTFKSVTAFREDDTESPIDFDSQESEFFDVLVEYKNEQTSQEFQFLYDGERIQGLAGIYYLDANAFNAFDVVFGTFGATDFNGVSYDPGRTQFSIGDVDTSTWAIFTDFSIDLSDAFALSLGARYTEDKRTSDIFSQRYSRTNFGTGDLVSPYFGGQDNIPLQEQVNDADGNEVYPNFHGSRTDTSFTPRISLSWTPNDDLHIYGGYSQGFKGGGFNPRGDFTNETVREGFDPETVDALELGIKQSLFDNMINYSAAIFLSDYSDVQIPGSVITFDADGNPNGFIGTFTNAGAATIKGFELEATVNVTDSFSSKIAFGYIDAEYDEYMVNGVNIADQRQFQNTPSRTGTLALTYDIEVGPGELTLNGSANYTSATSQFEIPQPLLDQPAYTVLNASIVWTSDSDHWQAGLHGRNLADKEYIVSGYDFASVGVITAFYGNPRTITGTVKYNF